MPSSNSQSSPSPPQPIPPRRILHPPPPPGRPRPHSRIPGTPHPKSLPSRAKHSSRATKNCHPERSAAKSKDLRPPTPDPTLDPAYPFTGLFALTEKEKAAAESKRQAAATANRPTPTPDPTTTQPASSFQPTAPNLQLDNQAFPVQPITHPNPTPHQPSDNQSNRSLCDPRRISSSSTVS